MSAIQNNADASTAADKTVHTPGPWETSRDAVPDWHTQITVRAEQDGERVATVFRTEANAHLIAAAPVLLQALRDICDCISFPEYVKGNLRCRVLSVANAAISLATEGAR